MSFANFKGAIQADRPVVATLLGCALPWVLTLLFFSNLAVLVHFIATLIILAGLGNLVLKGTSALFCPEDRLLLSPSLGFVVAGSVIALGVKQGISPNMVFWIIAIVGLTSSTLFFRDMVPYIKNRVPYALAYFVLSTLVCGVYFVPVTLRDAIVTKTGGFNWIYIDTQYMTALAASVKSAIGSPRMPGLWPAELKYHFAAYAIPGAMSAATGIELGDAVVRVMRGVAQLVLLLSATGFSLVLGRTLGAGALTGLLGSFGLFFYGSLTSLFARVYNSWSSISGALFFDIPNISAPSYGGPFDHIILGHSVLNGMIGLTALLGVLLIKFEESRKSLLGPDIFFLIPGLLLTINTVAGIGAAGIVTSVILIFGIKQSKAWLSAAVTVLMTAAVFKAMGYADSADSMNIHFNPQFLRNWSDVFVWVFFGLGFRVYGFFWLQKPNKPAGWVVIIATLGFCLYSVLLHDPTAGGHRYGFLFLQALMSLFAFSALATQVESIGGRSVSVRSSFLDSILYIYFSLGLMLLVPPVLVGLKLISKHPDHPGKILYLAITVCFFVVVGSILLLGPLKRATVTRSIVTAVMVSVYTLGFFAWVAPWANFGLGRQGFDVKISPGEFEGLRRLRNLSGHGELFATNRHTLSSIKSQREMSYSYMTLAERPALLEGWLYRENLQPVFQTIKDQNDLLFQSKDPSIVESIVKKYNIKYIVGEPGTDIALSPVPEWLHLEVKTGSLKIYTVKFPSAFGVNSP